MFLHRKSEVLDRKSRERGTGNMYHLMLHIKLLSVISYVRGDFISDFVALFGKFSGNDLRDILTLIVNCKFAY